VGRIREGSPISGASRFRRADVMRSPVAGRSAARTLVKTLRNASDRPYRGSSAGQVRRSQARGRARASTSRSSAASGFGLLGPTAPAKTDHEFEKISKRTARLRSPPARWKSPRMRWGKQDNDIRQPAHRHPRLQETKLSDESYSVPGGENAGQACSAVFPYHQGSRPNQAPPSSPGCRSRKKAPDTSGSAKSFSGGQQAAPLAPSRLRASSFDPDVLFLERNSTTVCESAKQLSWQLWGLQSHPVVTHARGARSVSSPSPLHGRSANASADRVGHLRFSWAKVGIAASVSPRDRLIASLAGDPRERSRRQSIRFFLMNGEKSRNRPERTMGGFDNDRSGACGNAGRDSGPARKVRTANVALGPPEPH